MSLFRGLLSVALIGGASLLSAVASAQSLIGPQPYNFPARSGQAALILYEGKKNASSKQDAGGYRVYNNTTISAANWQQIEMTLGDGSEATMTTDSSQSSEGGTSTSSSEFFNALEEELVD